MPLTVLNPATEEPIGEELARLDSRNVRKPISGVGLIVPWSFPLNIASGAS